MLISCGGEPGHYIPVTPIDLSQCKTISSKDSFINDYLLSYPTSMFVDDEHIIIKDEKGHKFLFHVLDKKGNIIQEFLTKGNGSEEYAFSNFNAQMDDDGGLEVFDSARKRIISFHKQGDKYRFLSSNTVNTDSEYVMEAITCGDYVLAMGMNGLLNDNRCIVLDKQGKVINVLGDYPEISPELLDNPEKDLAVILNHTPIYRVSPNQQKMVFASYKGSLVEFFDLSLLPDSIVYKSIQLEIPIDKTQKTSGYEGWIYGFEDAFVTDNFVYFVYNGQTALDNPGFGEYILKYNWEGSLLEKYKFDVGIRSLAVDERNGILYYIGYVDDELKLFTARIL